MLFWTLNLAMVTLLVTGIIMWRQYFSHYFSIPVLRIAILLHSASAFMLFTGILVHIYMAFWVKGSIRGIVEGWVTVRWAKNTTQDGIVKKFYQNLRKIYSTSNLAK